jgi:UDP-glucuronate decarboxylase
VYGDGSQTRSFCYVDDMVEGMIRMMEQDRAIGPVNLGNPRETSILEMARLILELVGGNSRIVHHDLPADDPIRRRPDVSLAKKLLDWAPEVDLETGLPATIDDFRTRLS